MSAGGGRGGVRRIRAEGGGGCEVARYDVLFLVRNCREDFFVSREGVRKVIRASKWEEALT